MLESGGSTTYIFKAFCKLWGPRALECEDRARSSHPLSPYNKGLMELPYSRSVSQRESPKKAHFGILTDLMQLHSWYLLICWACQWEAHSGAGADPPCSSRGGQFQFGLYPFTFKHALAKRPLSNSRCHHRRNTVPPSNSPRYLPFLAET